MPNRTDPPRTGSWMLDEPGRETNFASSKDARRRSLRMTDRGSFSRNWATDFANCTPRCDLRTPKKQKRAQPKLRPQILGRPCRDRTYEQVIKSLRNRYRMRR